MARTGPRKLKREVSRVEIIIAILAVLGGLFVGVIGGYFGRRIISGRRHAAALSDASRVLEDASEQTLVAEETGLLVVKELAIGPWSQRISRADVIATRTMQVREHDDAIGPRDADHLVSQQPLVPNVRKRVREHHDRERIATERQRVVDIAADWRAVEGDETGGEPQLPEGQVGEQRVRVRRAASGPKTAAHGIER